MSGTVLWLTTAGAARYSERPGTFRNDGGSENDGPALCLDVDGGTQVVIEAEGREAMLRWLEWLHAIVQEHTAPTPAVALAQAISALEPTIPENHEAIRVLEQLEVWLVANQDDLTL